MKHEVRIYDNNKNICTMQEHFRTGEEAYAEYLDCIRLIKKYADKNTNMTVVRINDGYIMTFETIKG